MARIYKGKQIAYDQKDFVGVLCSDSVKWVELLRNVRKNGKIVCRLGDLFVCKGLGKDLWFGVVKKIAKVHYDFMSATGHYRTAEYRIYGPSVVYPGMKLYKDGFHFWSPEDWLNELQFNKVEA